MKKKKGQTIKEKFIYLCWIGEFQIIYNPSGQAPPTKGILLVYLRPWKSQVSLYFKGKKKQFG